MMGEGMRATHAIPGIAPADFRAADAGERLARLGRLFPSAVGEVEELARLSPDPDLALAGVERYADAAGGLPRERDLLEALALLCGASRLVAGAVVCVGGGVVGVGAAGVVGAGDCGGAE